MNDAGLILKQHNLKSTKLRTAVLSVLTQADKGLSHQEISTEIDITFDRVTLFRTLHAFEMCGILHKVLDNNGVAKYAFSNAGNSDANGCHAHFVCIQCQQVFCLEQEVIVSNIHVPESFQQQSIEVQIKGLCKGCCL